MYEHIYSYTRGSDIRPYGLLCLDQGRYKIYTSMVKLGKFGHSSIFRQPHCFFHFLIIGIKIKLTKQTVKILMRQLIKSCLIWIFTVKSRLIGIFTGCKCMSEFTRCPKLPDYTLCVNETFLLSTHKILRCFL